MKQNLPNIFHLLLSRGLSLANKQMSLLLRAARNLHKLIKLQNPPLAARPSFATLVENRRSWMVLARFTVPRSIRVISSFATLTSASGIRRNRERRIIRIRLWCRRRCCVGGWCRKSSRSCGDRRRRLGSRLLGDKVR